MDCNIYKEKASISLKTLLDTMAAMIIINRGENVIYANKTFFDKTGYKNIQDFKFSDIFCNDKKDFIINNSLEVLNENKSFPKIFEDIPILNRNKNIKLYCDLFPDIIFYEEERATIYTIIDKTMYRKNEKALEEFFEHCPVAVYIRDYEGRAIKLSKHFEKMFNKSTLDLIGKKIEEIWPNDYAQRIIDEDKYVIDHKKSLQIEGEYHGQHYITTKFPINGNLVGGFSIDITDRVNIEKSLLEANNKYYQLYSVLSSLIDAIPEMMWIYDKSKNLRFANKALKQVRIDGHIFSDDFCMLIPDEKEISIQVFFINGEERYFEITKTPLFDDNNYIIGCSGILRDVTESINKQKQILKKLELLEGKTIKDTKDAINTLNSTIKRINERWGD